MREFESIGMSGYISDDVVKDLYQDYKTLIVYSLEPKIPSSEYAEVINMIDKIDNFPYDKFRGILEGSTSDRSKWVSMLFALYLVDKTKYKNSIDRIVKKYNPDDADDFYNLGKINYTINEKAGFDTGDGLAQNIQANPVSDNKPKESATGLVFDTVPDQPQQQPQEQPTTQTDLNSIIYGTGNNNNNQTQNNGEQKPKGKRPWCKYMLDRGSDAYLREKFKQLGRNDFDQVISIMRQLLSNRSAIELIYNITRETNLLFGIRGVVDANNFSLWAYINEKEIICCDFHNGTLNAYKQPSNQ